jgi:hypothetical protein
MRHFVFVAVVYSFQNACHDMAEIMLCHQLLFLVYLIIEAIEEILTFKIFCDNVKMRLVLEHLIDLDNIRVWQHT